MFVNFEGPTISINCNTLNFMNSTNSVGDFRFLVLNFNNLPSGSYGQELWDNFLGLRKLDVARGAFLIVLT